MRFAKLGEEVYERQSELVGEELRLYIIIFFHTWVDTRKCNKNLRELSKIYRLDYDNSCRRLKSLRKKKWIEDTKRFIRPMVGFKTVKTAVDDQTVKFTVPDDKTVEFTVEKNLETVNSTVQNCKSYSEIDVETVNSTVSSIPYIEPFKDEIFPTAAAAEKTAAEAAVETLPHQSIFSLSECLRYAEICKLRGEQIRSVEALATSAYKNGNLDAFISATLYPEKSPIQEISDAHSDQEMIDALALLRDVQAMGEDISGFEKYYAPELWTKLMGELRNVE